MDNQSLSLSSPSLHQMDSMVMAIMQQQQQHQLNQQLNATSHLNKQLAISSSSSSPSSASASESIGAIGDTVIVITLVALIVISIVGNLLVCVAVFTERKLRKLGNAFIVSLAIADLFVSCLVMTFALCNELLEYWPFGDHFCDLFISLDIMCCTASILNLCAISLDRFIMIKDCLLYNRLMTRKIALASLILIWFISALVSFVPITLGWHKPDHRFTSTASSIQPAPAPAPPLNYPPLLDNDVLEDAPAPPPSTAIPRLIARNVVFSAPTFPPSEPFDAITLQEEREQRRQPFEIDQAQNWPEMLPLSDRQQRQAARTRDDRSPSENMASERVSRKEAKRNNNKNDTPKLVKTTDGFDAGLLASVADGSQRDNNDRSRQGTKHLEESTQTPTSNSTSTSRQGGENIEKRLLELRSDDKNQATQSSHPSLLNTRPRVSELEIIDNLGATGVKSNFDGRDLQRVKVGDGRGKALNPGASDKLNQISASSAQGLEQPGIRSLPNVLEDKKVHQNHNATKAGYGVGSNSSNNSYILQALRRVQREANAKSLDGNDPNDFGQDENVDDISDKGQERKNSLTSSSAPSTSDLSNNDPAASNNGDNNNSNSHSNYNIYYPINNFGANSNQIHQVNGVNNGDLPQCILTLTPTYAIVSSTISFYIPCIIMIGLYTKLYVCAMKHVKNIQSISKAPAPILGIITSPSIDSNSVNSNGSQQNKRQRNGNNSTSNNNNNNNSNSNPDRTTTATTNLKSTSIDNNNDAKKSNSSIKGERERVETTIGKAASIDLYVDEDAEHDCDPDRMATRRRRPSLELERAKNNQAQPSEEAEPFLQASDKNINKDIKLPPTSTANGEKNSGDNETAGAKNVGDNDGKQQPDKSRSIRFQAINNDNNNNKRDCCDKDGKLRDTSLSRNKQQQQQQSMKQTTSTANKMLMKMMTAKSQANSCSSPLSAGRQPPNNGPSLNNGASSGSHNSGHLATHKAAITLGIIMGTFLFCWVPFFCINIIKAFCSDCITSSMFRFFTWLGYANSALNPIIYGIHNSEFRCAFNRIFFKHLSLKNTGFSRRFSYDARHQNNQQRTSNRNHNHQHKPIATH